MAGGFKRVTAIENKYNTFQGQERIDALDLGWYQFKWRNHDPTIGRFFNIDPLADSYVYNSPYAFSENRVVRFVELEGMERACRDPATGLITPASDHFRYAPPSNAQFLSQPIDRSGINVKLNTSIGFQAGFKAGKTGAEINFGSKELGSVSLKEGLKAGNPNETKENYNVSVAGLFEIAAEKTTTTEKSMGSVELFPGIVDQREITTEKTIKKSSMGIAGFSFSKDQSKTETTVDGLIGSQVNVGQKQNSIKFSKGELLPVNSSSKFSISAILKLEVEIEKDK